MKRINLTKYTDFIVKETMELLNIDSPTGYTENAAAWVKKEFEKLGFKATLTNKGGVVVDLTGKGFGKAQFIPEPHYLLRYDPGSEVDLRGFGSRFHKLLVSLNIFLHIKRILVSVDIVKIENIFDDFFL